MSIVWCALAWLVIATRSKMWWDGAAFWFVLAVVNELLSPVCPGYNIRSILFFLCSFGFLLITTGYIKPERAKK